MRTLRCDRCRRHVCVCVCSEISSSCRTYWDLYGLPEGPKTFDALLNRNAAGANFRAHREMSARINCTLGCPFFMVCYVLCRYMYMYMQVYYTIFLGAVELVNFARFRFDIAGVCVVKAICEVLVAILTLRRE